MHAAEDAVPRRARRSDREDLRQTFGVDFRFHQQVCEQRLQLRCEQEARAALGIEQRFDPKAVTGHEQALLLVIPDRKSEDAVQPLHARRSPLDVGCQQHLRVGMAAELMPARQQIAADVFGVVQLAIVANRIGVVSSLSRHRLGPACRVDHRETAMGKSGVRRHPDAFRIRAAVEQGISHLGKDRTLLGEVDLPVNPACNSAHIVRSPPDWQWFRDIRLAWDRLCGGGGALCLDICK